MVPQKLAIDMAYEPNIPQDRTHDMLMKTSFLTLGGWDENDYNSEIKWMDTGDGWNQTLTELRFDGEAIVTEYDLIPVSFEVGYPYIGMSKRFYDKIA